MCRLLLVKSKEEFSIPDHLEKFSAICKNSKEYQGHGWGLAYLKSDEWNHYKNILPIWEDDLSQFDKTDLLLVHARSAFRDQDIKVENNMPFYDSNKVFIFNGELNGVKIKAEGRIGAEKIFNFINRFDNHDLERAFEKGIEIINKRTKYIKAMNIILSNKDKAFVNTQFNEEKDYFTMSSKQNEKELIICSDPLDDSNWNKIPNNTLTEFSYDSY